MSGFRFNGCGATDHFKRVKSLGIHTCPSCKKDTEFFLSLAKFKIDIFFIPTVTLKSRYAVMCSKCGNGAFCSGEWAAKLINSEGTPQIIFESEAEAQKNPGTSSPAPQPAAQAQVEPSTSLQTVFQMQTESLLKENPKTELPKIEHAVFKCKRCGVTQLREGKFCLYCGEPVSDEIVEEK